MKTLQIICLFVLIGFGTSCKNEPKTPSVEQQEQGALPEISKDTILPAIDTVTARKSRPVDIKGSYSGILPCGDCKGIKTDLTLNADKTYELSSEYLGKETKPNVYKGTFSLDDATQVITLDAEGDHLKFKLQGDSVKKLDKFGAEEQGGPAEKYILKKV
jgi:uncharacterized lipoprotein NlpE involved in copper resistance